YDRQSLVKIVIWDKLISSSSPVNIVMGNNVRAVLTYVEKEEADLGFVYFSDALISKKVKIIYRVENNLHDKIVYTAAIIKDTSYSDLANKFLIFLKSNYSQKILISYGFKKE
ncbi:MAG: molybdate ABC transporter substrate-binding protein, partial [Candidatus Firestonebacteria bacterium]|nr:molybdate ABC transporter substrate-binding protein [Candidatus Firestonebacteria bacterium]